MSPFIIFTGSPSVLFSLQLLVYKINDSVSLIELRFMQQFWPNELLKWPSEMDLIGQMAE